MNGTELRDQLDRAILRLLDSRKPNGPEWFGLSLPLDPRAPTIHLSLDPRIPDHVVPTWFLSASEGEQLRAWADTTFERSRHRVRMWHTITADDLEIYIFPFLFHLDDDPNGFSEVMNSLIERIHSSVGVVWIFRQVAMGVKTPEGFFRAIGSLDGKLRTIEEPNLLRKREGRIIGSAVPAALIAAAEQGEPAAQWDLSQAIFAASNKADIEQHSEAVEWVRKAAEQGHAEAQFTLAFLCSDLQEHSTATDWFRLAAEQGHTQAQNSLGIRYMEGRGVAENLELAEKWLRRAATNGSVEAEFNVGVVFAKRDPDKVVDALSWFESAARKGCVPAQHEAGVALLKLNQVAAATGWFEMAAQSGHAAAQDAVRILRSDHNSL